MGLAALTELERQILKRFCTAARALCGTHLRDLRVYGSRVRGQGHEESDLDVFVLLDFKDKALEHALDDLAADLQVESGVMLDPRVWGEDTWREWLLHERALALAIEREGVRV